MKKRVNDLKDRELDYFVALAEGKTVKREYFMKNPRELGGVWLVDESGLINYANPESLYRPTTNWGVAGPIIERELIAVEPVRNQEIGSLEKRWQAYFPKLADFSGWYSENLMYGDTFLIAAMRCYVSSKFGDDVDMP